MSLAWLDGKTEGSPEGHVLKSDILNALASVGWSSHINGRLRVIGSIEDLFVFLSNAWLNSHHVNILIELIKFRYTQSHPTFSPPIIVAPTEITDQILKAYRERDGDGENKRAALAAVEHDLVSGYRDSLAGILFVSGNHWTAYMINVKEHSISYGDSFGHNLPVQAKQAFVWWLGELLALKNQGVEGQIQHLLLPITRQKDGFSCGILATNALAHYCLPGLEETNLLVGKVAIAHYRIRRVLEILRRSAEWVSV
jgi:hypothetical protein